LKIVLSEILEPTLASFNIFWGSQTRSNYHRKKVGQIFVLHFGIAAVPQFLWELNPYTNDLQPTIADNKFSNLVIMGKKARVFCHKGLDLCLPPLPSTFCSLNSESSMILERTVSSKCHIMHVVFFFKGDDPNGTKSTR